MLVFSFLFSGSGDLFWSYPKRFPRPLTFDAGDPLHLDFVSTLASAWAKVCGIQEEVDADVTAICADIEVAKFVSRAGKKIVTDEAVTKTEAEEDDEGGDGEVNVAEVNAWVKNAKKKVHPSNGYRSIHDMHRSLYRLASGSRFSSAFASRPPRALRGQTPMRGLRSAAGA